MAGGERFQCNLQLEVINGEGFTDWVKSAAMFCKLLEKYKQLYGSGSGFTYTINLVPGPSDMSSQSIEEEDAVLFWTEPDAVIAKYFPNFPSENQSDGTESVSGGPRKSAVAS